MFFLYAELWTTGRGVCAAWQGGRVGAVLGRAPTSTDGVIALGRGEAGCARFGGDGRACIVY